MVERTGTGFDSSWNPRPSSCYPIPLEGDHHSGNELAGSFRKGRPGRTILRDSSRRELGCEGAGGMVAPLEPCDSEGDCDPRSLPRSLHSPHVPEIVWEVDDAEGLLELRIRRGLGALLRRDDARRRIRSGTITIHPVEGGFVEGLPVHRLLQDAHARNDIGRGSTVHHEKRSDGRRTRRTGGVTRNLRPLLLRLYSREAVHQEGPRTILPCTPGRADQNLP